MLTLDKRLNAFALLSDFMYAVANKTPERLPDYLLDFYERFQILIPELYDYNGWFTEEFVRFQLNALAKATTRKKLEQWVAMYPNLEKIRNPKTVAVIMAGNIPLVGFSDFIAVLISGNKFLGKLSSKDSLLPKYIANVLIEIEKEFSDYIILTEEGLRDYDFDAVIATGSDNSARYFEYYFGKYPNIIRRNRTSVAVLKGDETHELLEKLADDIFVYFGLGCRNVSKIYLPQGFDLDKLFAAFYKYNHLINYHKYANNYEYNRAIYLLNKQEFYDNGFVLLKPEDLALVSPTAVVFYQFYKKSLDIADYLKPFEQKIQIVIGNEPIRGFEVVGFGEAQYPEMWNYPDGIDVLEFLLRLSQ